MTGGVIGLPALLDDPISYLLVRWSLIEANRREGDQGEDRERG
jgi:hypothetical protein